MGHKTLERAQDARAHQCPEAAVKKLSVGAAFAVAINRAGEKETRERRHDRISAPGREMGDSAIETHRHSSLCRHCLNQMKEPGQAQKPDGREDEPGVGLALY